MTQQKSRGARLRSIPNRILRRFGLEVVKAARPFSQNYDAEREASEAIARIRDHTMVSYAPLVTLFQQARHCELHGIAGDYVECGVWKGGAAGLMALANQRYGAVRRKLHLFDVFDDICEPDPAHDGDFVLDNASRLSGVDKRQFAGRLRPLKGIYDSHGGHGTVRIVSDLLTGRLGYDPEHVVFHQGWFQDTLPGSGGDVGTIAILRLDGDFYASTKVCLEHLYERVVPGGFVILDDYGTREGCRKATDEFRARKGITAFMHHVNQDCRYWVKPPT
jgi:hypothetical protein